MREGEVTLRRFFVAAAAASAFLAAGAMLTSCSKIDALYSSDGPDGLILVDFMEGRRGRMICIGRPAAASRCTAETADFSVEAIERPGQMHAEWDNDGGVTIRLFGGDVVRCRSRSAAGVEIRLRRLPNATGRSNSWDDGDKARFKGVEDSCGQQPS